MENQNDSNVVNYKSIGLRIRKQRKEKGLTMDQLAEMVDVSSSFMGHIERGTRAASVETLARLCKALGLDGVNRSIPPTSNTYTPSAYSARTPLPAP